MDAEMLGPEVLASKVVVFQRRQKLAKELVTLQTERTKLAEYAIKQTTESELDQASWLTNFLAIACDTFKDEEKSLMLRKTEKKQDEFKRDKSTHT